MAAKYPFSQMPGGVKIDGNDDRHNLTDDNGGGSPTLASRKTVSDAHRGGPYQSGQRQYATTSISGTRGSSGNPASRGSLPPVGRQSTPSETRVPGHGGSPTVRPMTVKRQFGSNGKVGVVNDYANANPQPGAGNTGGKMAKRITGRFNNSSKGSKSGGNVGSYGDRKAIT